MSRPHAVRAVCPVCGGWYTLRADGGMRTHDQPATLDRPGLRAPCPGSGQPPTAPPPEETDR